MRISDWSSDVCSSDLQHQPRAVVDQMLVAGDAPEREGVGIRWRVGVRVELDHAVMVGEPDRMRVPRVQVWIFKQAQAPALGGLWSAATEQTAAAVGGISAQVFPRQRKAGEAHRVERGGGG